MSEEIDLKEFKELPEKIDKLFGKYRNKFKVLIEWTYILGNLCWVAALILNQWLIFFITYVIFSPDIEDLIGSWKRLSKTR